MGVGAIFGSDDQAKALKKAMKIMKAMYDQTRTDVMPWIEAGQNVTPVYEQMVMQGAPTVEDYEKSPYFDFLQQQGSKQLAAQASAQQGGVGGGAYEKALMQYNQNLAKTDFDQYRNRYFQDLVPFQTLSQLGLNAGLNLGQIGNQNAATQANLQTQIGQADANKWAGIENALGSLVGFGNSSGLFESIFKPKQIGGMASSYNNPSGFGRGYLTDNPIY